MSSHLHRNRFIDYLHVADVQLFLDLCTYVDGLLAAVAEQITGIISWICTNYQQGRLMPMCFAVTVGCFSAWGGDLVLAGAHMLIVTVLILLRMWKVQEGVVHLILSFAFATIQKSFALVGFATTSVAPPKVIQEAPKAGKQRLPAIRTGRHKLQARNVNLLGKEHRPKSIFSRGWDFVSHLPAVFRKLYVPCSFSSLPPKQCEDTVNQTQNGGTKRIRAGVPWSKLRFVCPTRAAKRTKARRRPRKRRDQFEPKVQESEWSGKAPTVCFQQNKWKPKPKTHVASSAKFSAKEHVALQGLNTVCRGGGRSGGAAATARKRNEKAEEKLLQGLQLLLQEFSTTTTKPTPEPARPKAKPKAKPTAPQNAGTGGDKHGKTAQVAGEQGLLDALQKLVARVPKQPGTLLLRLQELVAAASAGKPLQSKREKRKRDDPDGGGTQPTQRSRTGNAEPSRPRSFAAVVASTPQQQPLPTKPQLAQSTPKQVQFVLHKGLFESIAKFFRVKNFT